jgi:hypothetical protein
LFGGLFYNWAIFFDGIEPMNGYISNNLMYLEYPIYYFSWGIVIVYLFALYYKKQQKQKVILQEVLNSMARLKDYYDGAVFVIQVDGDSLKKHLGQVSFITKYLIDAEKYLGGDGNVTLIIENTLIKKALTKDTYQLVLTELAHHAPESSKTILNDTLKSLINPEYIADISLAHLDLPLLFISLQSDLTLDDIANAKQILKTQHQPNKVIFEIGCFDSDSTILTQLKALSTVSKQNWFSTADVDENVNIEIVLKTLFDRFTEYIEELQN